MLLYVALQPGDDREFKNQMTEYLQKNLPMDSQEKIAEEVAKSKIKRKKRTSKNSLDYFFKKDENSPIK